jgi:hypothetical protein
VILALLVACTAAQKGSTPTWSDDVAPIVQSNCSSCHQTGGAAFDLTDPAAASAMAASMASAVEARRMPPWGASATADCAPTHGYANDRSLSQEEIDTLVAWSDAGAPVEDGAVAIDPAARESLTGALEIEAPGDYVTRGGQDEFVCLVMDPGNDDDVWVDAIEVVPGNAAIAHHALVFVDETGGSEGLANADGWYDCGTGTGFEGATFLSTWVPGSGPQRAPDGTGLRIPGGSRIVMQMHYHPGGELGTTDRTALRLRQMDDAPRWELHNTLLGNAWSEASGLLPGPNDRRDAEFRVPADVAGHTEEMRVTFDGSFPNLPITSVGAHMHLIGTAMEVWLERARPDAGEPNSECLLPASRYDYDWQQLYAFDGGLLDAPMISGGDSIRLRCTYDNTLDNVGTRRALESGGLDAPVDVYLGEGTLDEMCIALFSYVY